MIQRKKLVESYIWFLKLGNLKLGNLKLGNLKLGNLRFNRLSY